MTGFILNLDVDDLERGIAFYEQGLGLRLGRRILDGTVAEMVGGPCPIQLQAKPGRDYRRHWTPLHLDFLVDDLDAAMARAEAAGARREGEAESYAWGRIATYGDPFGHGFCLIQLTDRGYE